MFFSLFLYRLTSQVFSGRYNLCHSSRLNVWALLPGSISTDSQTFFTDFLSSLNPPLSELRRVFLFWEKPALTILKNAFGSTSGNKRVFLSVKETICESTFGGGVKRPAGTTRP